MYEIVSEQDGQAVGITVREGFTPDDREAIGAFLRDRAGTHGEIGVLFDLDALPRTSVDAAVDALAAGLLANDAVARAAFVGEEHWSRHEDRLAAVFPEAELQFFGVAHLAEAWAWIRGKV